MSQPNEQLKQPIKIKTLTYQAFTVEDRGKVCLGHACIFTNGREKVNMASVDEEGGVEGGEERGEEGGKEGGKEKAVYGVC